MRGRGNEESESHVTGAAEVSRWASGAGERDVATLLSVVLKYLRNRNLVFLLPSNPRRLVSLSKSHQGKGGPRSDSLCATHWFTPRGSVQGVGRSLSLIPGLIC